MQFDLTFDLETIGPLQLEYVVALLVTTGLARLAALAVWTYANSIATASRRLLFGGTAMLLVGLLLLMLPDLVLAWLYSASHPGVYVCTFVVWPGLLLPSAIYVWGLWQFSRKERRIRDAVA